MPYLSLSPLPFLDTLTLIGLLAGLTSFWVACHPLILRATPGSRVPEQKNVRESKSIPGPIIKSHLSILFENKL